MIPNSRLSIAHRCLAGLLWLAAAACATGNAGSATSSTPDTGLVAWWRLDETTGRQVADASGNGVHGAIVGEPKWHPTGGVAGGALELDGATYVAVTENARFDITDAITVSAWIKVTSFDRNFQAIVAKGDTSWRIARDRNRDILQFAFDTGPAEQVIRGETKIDDGKWHHVAGVYDGSQMFLYVDGNVDASQATTAKIPINDQPVYIGANSHRDNRQWNGFLDDVRVYSRGLSREEIALLFRQGEGSR